MKIYKRVYDGKEEGFSSDKLPNEYLGEFEITQTIMEDAYSGKWIGKKDGKLYLINQFEVSGMYNPENGGSRFVVEEINT